MRGCVHEAARDFRGEWVDEQADRQKVKQDWRDFARQYVKRKATKELNGLQPRKRRCTKKVQWVSWTGNALRHSVRSGWAHWQVVPERQVCSFQWPRITVALDESSDGKTAVFGLQSLGVNAEPVFDVAHGCCNNYFDAIKHVGEWTLLLLTVITFNLVHMPFDEDRFLMTICHAMEEYFSVAEGPSDPLFQELLPNMVYDTNDLERLPEDGAVDTLFDIARCHSLWKAKRGPSGLVPIWCGA